MDCSDTGLPAKVLIYSTTVSPPVDVGICLARVPWYQHMPMFAFNSIHKAGGK